MFQNRKDAGQRLAEALRTYESCNGVVLGIPRGGIEVGYYVAKGLKLPLSMVVVRKLPFPDNPEAGFGAIAEDGSVYYQHGMSKVLPPTVADQIFEAQVQEVQRRIQVLREGKALPKIAGKTVILVDDGIAMGSTIQAAIMLCKNRKAGKLVVAVPVGSPTAVHRLENMVDEAIILEIPSDFRAVAQFYQNWYDVPDEEVIHFMQLSMSQ